MPGTESIETRAATSICRSMREKCIRSKRRFLDADARKASQKLYSQERYEQIVAEYQEFAQKLSVHGIEFISVSALLGDNVVERSDRMSWYSGPPFLHFLKHVTISGDRNLVDFRFPVQYVVRPDQVFRGFAGQVVSGTMRVGEEVPS